MSPSKEEFQQPPLSSLSSSWQQHRDPPSSRSQPPSPPSLDAWLDTDATTITQRQSLAEQPQATGSSQRTRTGFLEYDSDDGDDHHHSEEPNGGAWNNSCSNSSNSSDHDDDHDDGDGDGLPHHRHRSRSRLQKRPSKQRRQDMATYGIFLDDDDDNDHHRHQRSTKRKQQTTSSSHHRHQHAAAVPVFVKGKTLHPDKRENDASHNHLSNNQQKEATKITAASHSDNRNSLQQFARVIGINHSTIATTVTTTSSSTSTGTPKPTPATAESTTTQVPEEEHRHGDDDINNSNNDSATDNNDRYFWELLERGRGTGARSCSTKSPLAVSTQSSIGRSPALATAATFTKSTTTTTTTSPLPPPISNDPASYRREHHDDDAFVGRSQLAGIDTLPRRLEGSKKAAHISTTIPIVAATKPKNLGAWERHTKGFGWAMLQKMGYKGTGGLGRSSHQKQQQQADVDPSSSISTAALPNKHETLIVENRTTTVDARSSGGGIINPGITQPIQVKVRPPNLGLGYGNFQEATQLRTNREIEAQVRGISLVAASQQQQQQQNRKRQRPREQDFDADNTKNIKEDDLHSQLLPSVQGLLKQQLWKRSRQSSQQQQKQQQLQQNKAKNVASNKGVQIIIPCTEILAQASWNKAFLDSDLVASGKVDDDEEDGKSDTIGAASAPPPLAEELLYNVSLLLSTHEQQLHTAAHLARASQLSAESVQFELQNIKQELRTTSDRIQKLQHILEIIHEMEQVILSQQAQSTDDKDQDGLRDSMFAHAATRLGLGTNSVKQMQALIRRLYNAFTPDERRALKFVEILIPNMIGGVARRSLDQWKPLDEYIDGNKSQSSVLLVQNTLSLAALCVGQVDSGGDNDAADTSDEVVIVQRSVLLQLFLPKVRSALESSSSWRPETDTEAALQLLEQLLKIADDIDMLSTARSLRKAGPAASKPQDDSQVFPSEPVSEDEDTLGDGGSSSKPSKHVALSKIIKDALISDTIYNRLIQTLQSWKPVLIPGNSGQERIVHRLDLWILPWLPYFDQRQGLIPMLVADCKRKLKTCMSFLQKNMSTSSSSSTSTPVTSREDLAFLQVSLDTLRPWRGVLKATSLQDLVSSYVTPRLARSLSRFPISFSGGNTDQDWSFVDVAFQLHGHGLLADAELLSLIEGEVLPRWVYAVHSWLLQLGSSSSIQSSKSEIVSDEHTLPPFLTSIWHHYGAWRSRLFHNGNRESKNVDQSGSWRDDQHPGQVLRQDAMICRYFYAVLLLLELSSSRVGSSRSDERAGISPVAPPAGIDQMVPPKPSKTNYRVVLARRSAEAKKKAADDLIRMDTTGVAPGYRTDQHDAAEARVRLGRGGGGVATSSTKSTFPTFRDVVEECARERGILFLPRSRNGTSASSNNSSVTKDGKAIYLFGSIPVYLDANVIFVWRNAQAEWKPMSLAALTDLATEEGTA